MTIRLLFLALALTAAACSESDESPIDIAADNAAANNAQNAGNNQVTTELTYHADVRPILESNCANCHVAGGEGIAPFGLSSFDEVKPLATLIADSTGEKRMPPWPPSQECAELDHARVLSDADIATIREWADGGAPEGEESEYVAPEQAALAELGAPDLTIDIGTDYKPNPPVAGGIDDYHCFIVEPGITEDVWLNTHVTKPSNMQVAHHMLMHAVPGDQLQALRDREAESEGPGYTCFGGPQVPGATLLGGWVPGSIASAHPPGHGIRIPAGSVFVVQMHYNTISDPDGTDRTAIDLHFTDGAPDRELQLQAMAQPGLNIPAGESNDVETTSLTLPANVEVFGIAPHMHLLGTSTRAWAESPNGDETCLIDIPKWDFSWQGFYATKDPIVLERGTTVNVECTYDNSPDNQPEGRSPQDVRWGDGTYDEMCITYFVIGI